MSILRGIGIGFLGEVVTLFSFAIGSSPVGINFHLELQQNHIVLYQLFSDSGYAFYCGMAILLAGTIAIILVLGYIKRQNDRQARNPEPAGQ